MERTELLATLKRNLYEAQNRMKMKAYRKRREVEFMVGDLVWVKLQQYRRNSVAKRISHKLSPRYYGPYEVNERIGEVAIG